MKISVVIPTRNRDKYLDNTLNSLVNQTLDQECYEVKILSIYMIKDRVYMLGEIEVF